MEIGPMHLWEVMTSIAKGVVIVLLICSIYSLYVMIERLMEFRKAKKQSLTFAKAATMALTKDKVAGRDGTGAQVPRQPSRARDPRRPVEFQLDATGVNPLSGEDKIEAARRAIERESLITTADFKKGIGTLATIATTAPFIGLFGTVVGIINAFRGMAVTGSGGIGAVSAGIAEALVTTALGLFVAIPAAWMFNYFTNVLERFSVEMSNSSSELIDFFIKKHGGSACSPVRGYRPAASPTSSRTSTSRPLVDVCLVLLIIFMVVTPMLQKGVDVQLPETAKPEKMPGRRQAAHGGDQARRHRVRRQGLDPRRPSWPRPSRTSIRSRRRRTSSSRPTSG